MQSSKTTHKKDSTSKFQDFLEHLRLSSKNKTDKGEQFELAIRDFLRVSPEHNFSNVWIWKDWPALGQHKFTKQDSGIDLVAQEKDTSHLWAIQCKFYQEETSIDRKDVDSFLATSRGELFSQRLLVTTTYKWGKNAKEILLRRGNECRILDLTDLNEVDYDWVKRQREVTLKTPHKYQEDAVTAAKQHYKDNDRGQLIMACGTGKTYTSLQILEEITEQDAQILFLAPSISLIGQTLREYAYQAKDRPRFVIVCSDTKAGKDSDGYKVTDLPIPPTTNHKLLTQILQTTPIKPQRTIVLCTYQSLDQIKEAQDEGAPAFDLAICDEAHRTTGIEASSRGGNHFTKINDEEYVRCRKRLYMTATPRLYKEGAKNKAQQEGVELCSMDDHQIYGQEVYRLDFSTAIEQGLLTDYKVLILTIDQEFACETLQKGISNTNLPIDDAARLVGCYKALRDQGKEDGSGVKLSRAVGFVNSIKASKDVVAGFSNVVESLDSQEQDGFTCQSEHIDGTYNSIERHKQLAWLKEDAGYDDRGEKICRILMNSKCLTEGIDVPSLDAILFLQARKSQVDVVQAVGRVLRKSEDKKYGYVILPVVIPAGHDAVKELDNNQTYKVVWQVLNALRSHDNKFDTHINNLHLNKNKSDRIQIIGIGNDIEQQPNTSEVKDKWQHNIEDLSQRVYAKIVEKCGDRLYEDKWHKRIKEITDTVSARIDGLVKNNQAIKKKFQEYLHGLQASINKDVTIDDAKQVLAQHLVTKPAFDAIFKDYVFSKHNRVSKAMDKVLDSLDQYGFRNELADCEVFYEKISKRLEGIDNSTGRQTVIKDLYGNFLAKAFPKMSERLGIVYTPIELVDFALHSVEHLLQENFGKSLTDKGVQIIDPFVGTGSFLVRLLELNLIKDEDLEYKYRHEIHANDCLLLPYYLTAANLETAYQARTGKYLPFKNICLTDTFVSEREALANNLDTNNPFWRNFQGRRQQNSTDINVVITNPPHSTGQKSENDANKNITNPDLEQRIKDTYMANSNAVNKRNLLDSYVKAIRWASDRIGKRGGIIALSCNTALLDDHSMAGLRICLDDEFSSILVIDLHGNARTKGEIRKKEGDNIFGQACRTGKSFFFIIKNPELTHNKTKFHWCDIGNYLNSDQKLTKLTKAHSINSLEKTTSHLDNYGDCRNQRNENYEKFPILGNKKDGGGIFELYSNGIVTSRDDWIYNHCSKKLIKNMRQTISIYNKERQDLPTGTNPTIKNIDRYVERDPTKIKWSSSLKSFLIRNINTDFDSQKIELSAYRPFNKKYLYYCKIFNHRHSQTQRILPIRDNRWLCVSGIGANYFSVLMTNRIPDFGFLEATQCFPLYYLDANDNQRDGISNEAQLRWQKYHKDKNITKETIFYHFYGILHAKDYQREYQNNLVKGLPRMPFVDNFWYFEKIGRQLADLHVNYEQAPSTDGVKVLYRGTETKLEDIPTEALQVIKKMKIDKKDFKSIQYNNDITITDIPPQAWDHKINGYAPVKWVVERYYRKTDKKTQITDDPNKYSDDPLYILKLVLSTITVGIKTVELVNKLKPVIKYRKTA